MVNFATKPGKIFFFNCNTAAVLKNSNNIIVDDNYNSSNEKSLRIKPCNMEIRMDDININVKRMLSCIIFNDNVEMFQICLSSMSDEDIKKQIF